MANVMRKFTKHTKRRGAQPTKVLFSIEVLSLFNLLPALGSIGDEAVLSVCFERGGKMSCSTGIPFDSSPRGDGSLQVKQTLSLVATLYQETTGDFQEKTAKLILRQSKELLIETNKEISFPMEILRGGEATINIVISARTLANSDGEDDTSSLLSDSSDISTLGAVFDPDDFPIGALMTIGSSSPNKKMVLSPPFASYSVKKGRRKSMTETIHEVDEEVDSPTGEEEIINWLAEDDFVTTNSTTADDSGQSTNNSPMNLHHDNYTESKNAASENNPSKGENANKYDNTKQKLSYQSAINDPQFSPENKDGYEKTHAQEQKIIAVKLDDLYPSSTSYGADAQDSDEKKSETKIASPERGKIEDINTKNKDFRNNNVKVIGNYMDSVNQDKTDSSTDDIKEPQIESTGRGLYSRPERNNFAPYLTSPLGAEDEETLEAAAERVGVTLPPRMSPEVLQLKATIEMMRRQIQARDTKIRILELEALEAKETFELEMKTTRTDLITADTSLKREVAARMALEAGFVTEENYLTARYAIAQKGVKELTSEYASCCAVLRSAEQELVNTKKELKLAQQSEAVEMAAALEAAGVATSAALRRAELEEETDGMLEALINSKILSADLAIQVDEEKKKIFVLRRRLQKYAEKMAAMELATVVQGLQRQDVPATNIKN